MTVDDTMTPRGAHRVASTSPTTSTRSTRACRTAHHTRLVVYEGSLDNVVGHPARAQVPQRHAQRGSSTKDEILRAILREPYFVPEGTGAARPAARTSRSACATSRWWWTSTARSWGWSRCRTSSRRSWASSPASADRPAALYPQRDRRQRDRRRRLPAARAQPQGRLRFPARRARRRSTACCSSSSRTFPSPARTLDIAGHPVEIMQVQNRMVKVVRILPQGPARQSEAPGRVAPQARRRAVALDEAPVDAVLPAPRPVAFPRRTVPTTPTACLRPGGDQREVAALRVRNAAQRRARERRAQVRREHRPRAHREHARLGHADRPRCVAQSPAPNTPGCEVDCSASSIEQEAARVGGEARIAEDRPAHRRPRPRTSRRTRTRGRSPGARSPRPTSATGAPTCEPMPGARRLRRTPRAHRGRELRAAARRVGDHAHVRRVRVELAAQAMVHGEARARRRPAPPPTIEIEPSALSCACASSAHPAVHEARSSGRTHERVALHALRVRRRGREPMSIDSTS